MEDNALVEMRLVNMAKLQTPIVLKNVKTIQAIDVEVPGETVYMNLI